GVREMRAEAPAAGRRGDDLRGGPSRDQSGETGPTDDQPDRQHSARSPGDELNAAKVAVILKPLERGVVDPQRERQDERRQDADQRVAQLAPLLRAEEPAP